MGWEKAPFDDGAFGVDGFDDLSADCFGRAVADIDPFFGNDSVDGDLDWTTEGEEHVGNRNHKARSIKPSTSLKKNLKNTTKNKDRRVSSSLSPKRDTRSQGNVASKETRKGDLVLNKDSRRISPMNASPSRFGTSDKFWCVESDFDPFSVGFDSSGVSSPTIKDDEGFRNTFFGDGFADFANPDTSRNTFGAGSPPPTSPKKDPRTRASRVTTAAVTRSPVPSSCNDQRRCSSLRGGNTTRDVVSSSHEHSDFDRDGREQHSPQKLVSPGGRSTSSTSRGTHRRDGSTRRLLRNEERQRSNSSDSSRSLVKDAFDSSFRHQVGEADLGRRLSSYLTSQKTGRARKGGENGSVGGKGWENESVGGNSTKSAPAADRQHYRQSHRESRDQRHSDHYSPRKATSSDQNGGTGISPSSAGSKSRRWNNKMVRDSCRTKSEVNSNGGRLDNISVAVAQLVEQGYIEVVDGKMRLVVDLEAV